MSVVMQRLLSCVLACALLFLPIRPHYLRADAETATVTPSTVPNTALFGTGADGNVTISSGITSLTREMDYANLTINGTGQIAPNGFPIRVSGVTDVTGAQNCAFATKGGNGNNASGATGGTAGGNPGTGQILTNQTLPSSGPTATSGSGTAAATYTIRAAFSNGGIGGVGGASGANTGGVPVANTTTSLLLTNTFPLLFTFPPLNILNSANPGQIAGGGPGVAGGAGAGDGSDLGGGGGGAPTGGGGGYLATAILNRGASTAAGTFCATGGNGGNGGNGAAGTAAGGGSAGGAGGGWWYLLIGQLIGTTATNAIDVSGGSSGTGGNGVSTGKGGASGNGGFGGHYEISILNPLSFTASTYNATGTTGNTTSTASGASGVAGAVVKGNL